MIQTTKLSKAYGSHLVLAPLNLQFAENECTVLLGTSGSGKSTVLQLLAGLISPTTGEISIDGTRLTKQNARTIRQRIGYVLQEGGLFPHLTAEQNIRLVASNWNMEEQLFDRRYRELCALTQLSLETLQRYPAELSGGQRQRVALMRALIHQPKYLLLDEPLGALDPLTRWEMQQELKQIFLQLRSTVILVTHDIAEAAWFADRIILFQHGIVQQNGTFQELRAAPANDYVARYLQTQRAI